MGRREDLLTACMQDRIHPRFYDCFPLETEDPRGEPKLISFGEWITGEKAALRIERFGLKLGYRSEGVFGGLKFIAGHPYAQHDGPIALLGARGWFAGGVWVLYFYVHDGERHLDVECVGRPFPPNTRFLVFHEQK